METRDPSKPGRKRPAQVAPPPNPWDAKPILLHGDADRDLLYRGVGRCLSAWEMMEGILVNIFTKLIDANGEGAGQTYGQIVSFTGRRDLLSAALDCYPHRKHPALEGLSNFFDRLKDYSARRNEIAHGVVLPKRDGIGLHAGYYLVPAFYNARKRLSVSRRVEAQIARGEEPQFNWHPSDMSAEKYAYTAAQLAEYEAEFHRLFMTAFTYSDALRKPRPMSLLESLAQGARQLEGTHQADPPEGG